MTDENKSKSVKSLFEMIKQAQESNKRISKALHRRCLGDGIVEFHNRPNLARLFPPSDQMKLVFGLQWQTFTELDPDHGLQMIYEVLEATPFSGPLSARARVDILAEVNAHVGRVTSELLNTEFERVEKETRPEDRESHKDIILCAVWASINYQAFEPIWLAAMAQHAYWIEHDEFACGYLIAMLDQKLTKEKDFLRGRKSVQSGAEGARNKAAVQKKRTQQICSEMRRLVVNGLSVARAAEVAHKNGFGASAAANRKLWYRNK